MFAAQNEIEFPLIGVAGGTFCALVHPQFGWESVVLWLPSCVSLFAFSLVLNCLLLIFRLLSYTVILQLSKVDYSSGSLMSSWRRFSLSWIEHQGLYSTCSLGFQPPPHLLSCIGCLLRQEFNLKCLITFKDLKFNQPSYIREVLSFSSHESTLGLQSADDPYRLHEPRAIGERGFAKRSFSYIAPHLYNKLPIAIKLIDSLNTFKSHLKAFLFSRAYDQSGLTVQEDYAL